MASPVFKTAWAAERSPEGSTPFLLRRVLKGIFRRNGDSIKRSPFPPANDALQRSSVRSMRRSETSRTLHKLLGHRSTLVACYPA